MQVEIRFGGFYHSVHSDNIDWRIEQDYEWEFEEAGEEAAESLAMWEDKVSYRATMENYSEAYIDRLNNALDLDLLYTGLDSPRYYNYRTDKIVAEVSAKDQLKLSLWLTNEDFVDYADEHLTSRDGFISYYYGLDDLLEKSNENEEDKAILYGMIIDFLIGYEDINGDIYDLEYEIIYNE